MSSSMACTRTHDWSENHSWSSATRNDVNHPECFLKITGKGNDISNLTVGNAKNGRMSSSSVRDLSENPRRLCALVRRCARCECVGSEICALNPPVLRAATLRQRRPCGRELGPHRATQTIAPVRWKSTRATCSWQRATWSSLIAAFNWPSARNQNGGLCSCQQLSEKQEKLFPSSYQDIISRMP